MDRQLPSASVSAAGTITTLAPARLTQASHRPGQAVPSRALPALQAASQGLHQPSSADEAPVQPVPRLLDFCRSKRAGLTSDEEEFPPARPRPPKPAAKDSTIRRMSLAVRKALAPRSAYGLPSLKAGRNVSAPDLLQPRSRTPSPSAGRSRPSSPPYAPRLEARSLATSLMGPPLDSVLNSRSSRARPAESPGMLRPPASQLARPQCRSPTLEDVERSARVRRQRQAHEAAEVEERKRQSQWFTVRAAGELAPSSMADGSRAEWVGLRREDLLDVLALPGDVHFVPSQASSATPIRPADDARLAPTRSRPLRAPSAPSVWSAASVASAFSDDEPHHLATVVSPPASPATTDAPSDPWAGAVPAEDTDPPPLPSFRQASTFSNPYPLQPSPHRSTAARRPNQSAATPKARHTAFQSPFDIGARERAAGRPALRRIGVHAEVYTRETLGRRMRETDWGDDEESRRRTESIFLE